MNLHNDTIKTKSTLCPAEILKRDSDGPEHNDSFHYRSVINKLSHIDRYTRLDISYIVHQCARFSSAPKLLHNKALKWLGWYLKKTQNFGFVITPDFSRGLELIIDSDWTGNWDKKECFENTDTARSRFGFIILFADCSIFHVSRLITFIALSSRETEYIGLSETIRETISFINLVQELKKRDFNILKPKTKTVYKVFENNSGIIEIVNEDKFCPRTKYINIRFYHFRSFVQKGIIIIETVSSENNTADILTHSVSVQRFAKHIITLFRWDLFLNVSEKVLQYLQSSQNETESSAP